MYIYDYDDKRRARLPGEFGYGASKAINFIIFESHAKSYLNIMFLKSLVRNAGRMTCRADDETPSQQSN